jgi:hypothetical protein
MTNAYQEGVRKGAEKQAGIGRENLNIVLDIIRTAPERFISVEAITTASKLSLRGVQGHLKKMLALDPPQIQRVHKADADKYDLYALIDVKVSKEQIEKYLDNLKNSKEARRRVLNQAELEEYKIKILRILSDNSRNGKSVTPISSDPKILLSRTNTQLILNALVVEKKIALTMIGSKTDGPLYYRI